jgi:hypothetical protein
MGQSAKRHIGRILLDGRFLSQDELDCALEEQKNTKELLGQVLVRMGVLKQEEVVAPLILQEHLGTIDDAVKIAAGERQLLGALLVQSGHISNEKLDHAITERQRSGEKIGQVFKRLGMLTDRQLNALLDFQHNQEDSQATPLRLGELLIATGHISREQLDDALLKQTRCHKKLGEILVEAGYARPSQITYGIRLQKKLLNAVLAAILSIWMCTSSNASSVGLQWDPNAEPDLAGYRVYYSSDSSTIAASTPIDVQKETTATISGLDPDKTYSFAVTAYNSAGLESSFSNIVTIDEQVPPTVAIISPANATSVNGTVFISINASDNVGVTRVEYYLNGQLMASASSAPFTHTWDTSSQPTGSYTLLAKAYDAAGNVGQSSSSTVTVVNDTIPPLVTIVAPANNAIVNGTVSINANASDNVGVSRVEIYCNGALMLASNVAPYSFNWDTKSVANGGYSLAAVAYDNNGNINQSSSVNVTVNNPVPDLTAPTISSFSLPATAASLTVPVTSLAATDNKAVSGYLITESATPPAANAAGWSATPPASFTFSAAGAKTAYAWAKDAAGNVSASRQASAIITLPDTTIPVATINSPLANATVSGTINVGVTASDNVAVTKVEFYVNGALSSTVTSPPYSFTWNTKSLSNGPCTLTAKAYDAAGNVGQSSVVTVKVGNTKSGPKNLTARVQ